MQIKVTPAQVPVELDDLRSASVVVTFDDDGAARIYHRFDEYDDEAEARIAAAMVRAAANLLPKGAAPDRPGPSFWKLPGAWA